MELARALALQGDTRAAVATSFEALQESPDNPEILTNIGLMYLHMGENYRAFDFLGNSLSHDPRNPRTILAAGSIMQVGPESGKGQIS